MRRIGAMLAGGLLALTLAGCGGGEGTSSVGTLAERAQSSLEDAGRELEVMTVEETVEHFKQLSPQVLGLEGQRVSEYDVYNQQASVPVDGIPCLELTVYDKNATDTNTPLGTYLYARDGTALYELDVETDTLTRLELA